MKIMTAKVNNCQNGLERLELSAVIMNAHIGKNDCKVIPAESSSSRNTVVYPNEQEDWCDCKEDDARNAHIVGMACRRLTFENSHCDRLKRVRLAVLSW